MQISSIFSNFEEVIRSIQVCDNKKKDLRSLLAHLDIRHI